MEMEKMNDNWFEDLGANQEGVYILQYTTTDENDNKYTAIALYYSYADVLKHLEEKRLNNGKVEITPYYMDYIDNNNGKLNKMITIHKEIKWEDEEED